MTHTIHVPATKQLINNIKRTRKARKQKTENRESRKRLIAAEEEDGDSVQMYNSQPTDEPEEDEEGHSIRLDAEGDDGEDEVEVQLGDDSLSSVDMEAEEDGGSQLHDVQDEYGDEEEDEKKGGRH